MAVNPNPAGAAAGADALKREQDGLMGDVLRAGRTQGSDQAFENKVEASYKKIEDSIRQANPGISQADLNAQIDERMTKMIDEELKGKRVSQEVADAYKKALKDSQDADGFAKILTQERDKLAVSSPGAAGGMDAMNDKMMAMIMGFMEKIMAMFGIGDQKPGLTGQFAGAARPEPRTPEEKLTAGIGFSTIREELTGSGIVITPEKLTRGFVTNYLADNQQQDFLRGGNDLVDQRLKAALFLDLQLGTNGRASTPDDMVKFLKDKIESDPKYASLAPIAQKLEAAIIESGGDVVKFSQNKGITRDDVLAIAKPVEDIIKADPTRDFANIFKAPSATSSSATAPATAAPSVAVTSPVSPGGPVVTTPTAGTATGAAAVDITAANDIDYATVTDGSRPAASFQASIQPSPAQQLLATPVASTAFTTIVPAAAEPFAFDIGQSNQLRDNRFSAAVQPATVTVVDPRAPVVDVGVVAQVGTKVDAANDARALGFGT